MSAYQKQRLTGIRRQNILFCQIFADWISQICSFQKIRKCFLSKINDDFSDIMKTQLGARKRHFKASEWALLNRLELRADRANLPADFVARLTPSAAFRMRRTWIQQNQNLVPATISFREYFRRFIILNVKTKFEQSLWENLSIPTINICKVAIDNCVRRRTSFSKKKRMEIICAGFPKTSSKSCSNCLRYA